MRILHIITTLNTGGAEKLISEITPMLRDKGHKVDLLTFDGSDTEFKKKLINSGIKVFSFGKRCNVYNPIHIFKLVKIMKGYDIVHTHNTAPQFFAAIANFFLNCKLVTTEHNTYNRRRDIIGFKVLDKIMYKQYSSIICISNQTKENLNNYLPSTKNKSIVINNGIDVATFVNAQQSKEAMNLRTKGDVIITMVGAFRAQKDQDTIIRSLKHLPINYKLWLIGDGIRHDSIELLIKSSNLQSRVKLWGIRNDIPEILKASDIVVMSSHWEGFGLAAVEGMAAGKPVIASNVDGLSQVIGNAGLLFKVHDDKTLASIIIHLMNDKIYYQYVANKCIERAKEFDLKDMVNEYNKVYEFIIK